MSGYFSRLATFNSSPYISSRSEDFAVAGFEYMPTSEFPDNVQCHECSINLHSWKRRDNPAIVYFYMSPSCRAANGTVPIVFRDAYLKEKAIAEAKAIAETNSAQDIQLTSLTSRQEELSELITSLVKPAQLSFEELEYQSRLAIFIAWLYTLLKPQPKDLAAAGFKYNSSRLRCSDEVRCTECLITLDGWESNDDSIAEHLRCSSDCQLIKKIIIKAKEALEAQKPTPTAQDLAFFDPSLEIDFLGLRLYHDIGKFVEHILQCADQYREADILYLLPKCLRGTAFTWYSSIDTLKNSADLAKCMEVLIAKFKK